MFYYGPPPRQDRDGGCFAFLAIFIIIAIIAAVIGWYILLFFLGLGLAVGCVFSLIIYIRALVSAIQELAAAPPHASNKLLTVLKGYGILLLKVLANSFRETMTVVSNSFTKFLNHRVLSFQKWMWLTVVLTVSVCEVLFLIAAIMFQFVLVSAILMLIFYLIVAVLLINLIAALGYTTVLAVADLIRNIGVNQRMDHMTFSSLSTFSAWLQAPGLLWKSEKSFFRTVIADTALRARTFLAYSGAHRLVSVQKWFDLTCAIAIWVVAAVFSLVFTLCYLIAFLAVWIANLFWTTGVVLFYRLHP
ncbi:MAG: hypothetical protein IKJ35_05545 [Clostridia bacterium]|nr:hypothetical protein [Clostridia bacterium]